MKGERRNLVGQKFGKLTVLCKVPRKFLSPGDSRWNCVCDCGSIADKVSSRSLFDVPVPSCGCNVRENRRKRMIRTGSAFNIVLSTYKCSCKIRHIEWSLSAQDTKILLTGNCHYCGVKPNQLVRSVGGEEFKYNGIDRLDNTRGYRIDNVVSCCWLCNDAKGTLSLYDFKSWVNNIFNYWACK